ncbi:MAG: 2-oxo acid dehydrogenase subunit E2 [Bacteroidetes bacterium]|nr:MAG: 2-oxo acid dehydrogenase subunit E2 [Bacteroidota bacterium]
MSSTEIIMPKMGESIFEATVIRWLKKEGERIEKDESILEVATDKVDTEVPSTVAGILGKIFAKEGETIKVGAVLAQIVTASGIEKPQVALAEVDENPVAKIETQVEQIKQSFSSNITTKSSSSVARFYSPLVLNIAKEEQISLHELETIDGSGLENRVTKQDILNYINKRNSVSAFISKPLEQPIEPVYQKPTENYTWQPTEIQKPNFEPVITPKPEPLPKTEPQFNGKFEVIEMDRMRKIIAQRMIESQKISATVTSWVETDVTSMVQWRGKVKNEFMKREGEVITFTPVFIEAIAKALKDYPMLNSSVDGDKIIIKKDINIGIAVALNDGNLIVPVLKHADRYNISGLTKAYNDLIRKTKAGKLTADDLSDGTYTISNIGGFGNVMGTPVLVQPQVGIMAFGSILKKPYVVETEHGDTIGIRHILMLSHSYDHRIIDGALGGSFAKKVSDYLEKFDADRNIFA